MKSAYISAAVLAVSSSLWIASGVWGEAKVTPEPVETKSEKKLTTVRVQSSQAVDWKRQVILFGHTEAVHDAEVRAETAGRIITRLVEKGAQVKKGDVLFRIAFNDRKARLEEAKAQLAYHKVVYNAAKKLSKKKFQSEVKLADEKARLETAKAQLENIKLDIRRTEIRSPIDGVVEELPLGEGDYASIGVIAARVVATNPLRVVARISERDVSDIKIGAAVNAMFPDGRIVIGEVRYVAQSASETTRTFRIDAWIDNSNGDIQQGLTTELELSIGQQRAHRISPAVLTLNDEGILGIKSVTDEGIVKFHKIRIVADSPEGIWISDLPEHLNIISVGQEYVSPGQKVLTSTGAKAEAS